MINKDSQDPNTSSVSLITSNTILSVDYFDVEISPFGSPDSNFTGYASTGIWYTAGVPLEEGQTTPFGGDRKAGWSEESGDTTTATRGKQDSFPDRIFIINTSNEISIIDADTLALWMKIVKTGTGFANVTDAQFMNGILVCIAPETRDSSGNIVTPSTVIVVDFMYNQINRIKSSEYKYTTGIENRASFGLSNGTDSTLSERLLSTNILSLDVNYIGNTAKFVVTQEDGFCGFRNHAQTVSNRKFARFKKHQSIVAKSSTTVSSFVKDGDSDSTNYILTSTQAFVTSDKISIGDTLQLTKGSNTEQFYILAVQETALGLGSVSANANINVSLYSGQSECALSITRPCVSASIKDDGKLFVATPNKVFIIDSDWDDATGSEISFFTRTSGKNTLVEQIINKDSKYTSTSLGNICVVSQENNLYHFFESTLTELPSHGSAVLDSALDPESTHLFYTDSGNINEMDLTTFTVIATAQTGISTIVAYRNPNGPPTKTVTLSSSS